VSRLCLRVLNMEHCDAAADQLETRCMGDNGVVRKEGHSKGLSKVQTAGGREKRHTERVGKHTIG